MTLGNLLRWKKRRVRFFQEELTFPSGLYGFEHLHIFLWEGEEGPYYKLKSLEDKSVAFVVADPFQIDPDYDPDLSLSDVAWDLRAREYLMLAIVLPENTLNLTAPLLIDWEKREGRQILFPAEG